MEDYRNVYGAGKPLVIQEEAATWKKSTLEQYKRHASRFGSGQVYETASRTLPLKDLIELVHALRALPPTGERRFREGTKWSLTKEQREELSGRMQNAGYKDKAITRVTKG